MNCAGAKNWEFEGREKKTVCVACGRGPAKQGVLVQVQQSQEEMVEVEVGQVVEVAVLKKTWIPASSYEIKYTRLRTPDSVTTLTTR